MSKIFVKVLFVFLVLFNLSLQKGHACIQDELDVKFGFVGDKEDNKDKGRNLQERDNIRITFDFSTLEQFTGDMVPLADEVKRQTELSGLFLSKSLKVNRKASKLIFPSQYDECVDYVVPLKDKTDGIENSDLHIYVNIFHDQESRTIAYAAPCMLNGSDNRPVFGVFAINLKYFKQEDVGKPMEFEDNFETIAHELTHILGFSRSLYPYFINPSTGLEYGFLNTPVITETIRGISTQWITTPKVKQLAQEYFGCPTAKGMQLENQGGSGSAHSHWERTVLENDYMTASAIGHDAVFSRFTMALLEDSGWYTPTYEYVDDIDWGKGQGCDFLYNCSSEKYREFNGSNRQCNFYHSSVATFSTSGTFSDYCEIPTVVSNLYCSNSANSSSDDQLTGNKYHEKSRCFDSNIVDNRLNSHSFPDHRCLEYKCNADATQIEITVAGEKYILDKQFNKVLVEPKGNNANITGYVDGPEDWNGFCNTYPLPCKNYCSSWGYCMGKTCHCHTDRAGEDCSVECPNNRSVYKGQCLSSRDCPAGTVLHAPTKECIGNLDQTPVSCKEGEFLTKQNTCQTCPQNCTQCTSLEVCLDCISGFQIKELNDGSVICEKIQVSQPNNCKEGEYLLTQFNECFPCNSSCKTCSNSESCDTCKDGYYKDLASNTCKKCYYGCTTCTQYTQCMTCQSGFKFVNYLSHRFCLPSCPKGFIEKEGECYQE